MSGNFEMFLLVWRSVFHSALKIAESLPLTACQLFFVKMLLYHTTQRFLRIYPSRRGEGGWHITKNHKWNKLTWVHVVGSRGRNIAQAGKIYKKQQKITKKSITVVKRCAVLTLVDPGYNMSGDDQLFLNTYVLPARTSLQPRWFFVSFLCFRLLAWFLGVILSFWSGSLNPKVIYCMILVMCPLPG